MSYEPALSAALEHARRYLASLPERDVTARATTDELLSALGGDLHAGPQPPEDVLDRLVVGTARGLTATTGGRYFGFVTGGVLPAALAADWLASTWDQNPGLYVLSPAAAVVEEVCRRWLTDLLGLPAAASLGFVTGGQMANVVGLAAARHHVLAAAGWDVEADGLVGAPPVRVVVGEERHATIDRALRFLGLGTRSVRVVPADGQGRLRVGALGSVLAEADAPTIVCAQAGNVNTGAFDPFEAICDAAGERGAWVHVDGAFGLWAGASPAFRHLVEGADRADSWATDGHKWLNVPYDCGLVFCAHPESHRAAMSISAAYLTRGSQDLRDGSDWSPEGSRRARGFAVWAALQSLGRAGVADLVDRCCAHARRFADRLAAAEGVEVLNDVVLNQVLVRFADSDEVTNRVIAATQADGTCWAGGTVWQGRAAMRISVSDWATTAQDVDGSVAGILSAAGR
jgi:glutamate/tyrosine decarboxylase-like PLP-dependent enzyme